MSKKLIENLKIVLADSYGLYLKTQNYHWNVTGPEFYSLHLMFEEQYKELANAVDEIAERIRALGEYAPGSYEEFAKLATIDAKPKKGSAKDLLKDLAKTHEAVIKSLNKLQACSAECDDPLSEDIAIGRLEVHQKTLWMINSSV